MSLTDKNPRIGNPGGKVRCLLWDWNGTLLDDVKLNIRCINTLLARRGLPEVKDADEYRASFGFPVEEYYTRLGFNLDEVSYDALAREYIELYSAGEGGCPLSPGAVSVLAEVRARGVRQVIISASKADTLTAQVAARGISGYFDEIIGSGDIYASSKEGRALGWLSGSGYGAEDLLFVGDTSHDVDVARTLGCRCLFYTGGHQSPGSDGDAAVIGSLAEVLDFL